jgi:3-hydroxyisobutyrate dehydrogenase
MRVGWIGTGVMGASMAGHLMAAGHELRVYTRSRQKAQALLDRGATWADTPAAVAAHSEVVFSILALDAPVSGGDVGARAGKLAIMVGGDATAYGEIRPLFAIMGENIQLMGGPGAGQHTKMCNQILIAGTMIGVCESLLYAERQGLDQQAVIDIIGKGAASSWSINTLGPRIAAGNYDPGFYVEHFIKDMGIALRESAACGLALPGLALVHQLYVAVQTQGHGRLGTQALMLGLRTLNGQTDS